MAAEVFVATGLFLSLTLFLLALLRRADLDVELLLFLTAGGVVGAVGLSFLGTGRFDTLRG